MVKVWTIRELHPRKNVGLRMLELCRRWRKRGLLWGVMMRRLQYELFSCVVDIAGTYQELGRLNNTIDFQSWCLRRDLGPQLRGRGVSVEIYPLLGVAPLEKHLYLYFFVVIHTAIYYQQFPYKQNMHECLGFEVMDDALFVLSHAIELNVDLQQVIIDLNKGTLSAVDIFRKIKPLWTYEKDIENIFWNKYPLFEKIDIKDQNLLLKITDFERFYSKVLQKILFKLAFHSVNAKPLLFTTPNLLYLIGLARVKKGTGEVQSFISYLKIIRFILQQNIAFQKLIIDWLFEQNILTSIEMMRFQRFSEEENYELMNIISPSIQQYCAFSKERIKGLTTDKWKIPQQFMNSISQRSSQHTIHCLQNTIRRQTKGEMDQEQAYIYNKFISHQQTVEAHLNLRTSLFISKQRNENHRRYAKKNESALEDDKNLLSVKNQQVRKSILHQIKIKSPHKKKHTSILKDNRRISIKDDGKSSFGSSAIKSRESILNSLMSFAPDSLSSSAPTYSQLHYQPQTNTIITETQDSQQSTAVSKRPARESVEVQTTQKWVHTKSPLRKAKMSIYGQQNKARESKLIPKQRPSILTISKLINFQNEQLPSQAQQDNEKRRSLMIKVLRLINTNYGQSNYMTGYTRKLSEFTQSYKQQFAQLKADITDPAYSIRVWNEKQQEITRKQSLRATRNSMLSEISKARSITTLVQQKGYDIYDTRLKRIIASKR